MDERKKECPTKAEFRFERERGGRGGRRGVGSSNYRHYTRGRETVIPHQQILEGKERESCQVASSKCADFKERKSASDSVRPGRKGEKKGKRKKGKEGLTVVHDFCARTDRRGKKK